MTIVANKLDLAARPANRRLKVRGMIEVDRSRITLSRSDRRKLYVLLVEIPNMRIHRLRTVGGFQIAVALRTSRTRNLGQMTLAGMFDMARTARRRESLELVMSRRVVARKARLVRHRSPIGGIPDMAYVAACRQHCVCRRERPLCINLLVS